MFYFKGAVFMAKLIKQINNFGSYNNIYQIEMPECSDVKNPQLIACYLFSQNEEIQITDILVESVNKIMSLSELSNFAKDLVSDDLEETIDNIVEEFHANNAYIENIIDELSGIENEALAEFIGKIESVNNRAMEYIARSIKNTNRRFNYK